MIDLTITWCKVNSTKKMARRIVVNIAKLPELLRKA
jgi:hypothetical protein